MEAVLFVYSSNQKAMTLLNNNQLRSPLRVMLLSDYNESQGLKTEAELAAKEIFQNIKPDIDSRVANRMITAALGLRRSSASSSLSTSRVRPTQKTRPREAPIQKKDSWDD
mmetsp:Transcript_8752/g.9270  ORF Transcript_8752/g.9270 Transcript_8752/m.9270 type:complete len:111 (-) Transcript_8752:50-382(-)